MLSSTERQIWLNGRAGKESENSSDDIVRVIVIA